MVGVGLGLAFTVASDVVLASVPKERAGAAAAVSETAYELGMALGIATLGSIVTGVYRGFPVPPACHQRPRRPPTTRWQPREAAGALHAGQADGLLTAAQAFTTGLAIASGVGSALLLAAAAAVWLLLKQPPPSVVATAPQTMPALARCHDRSRQRWRARMASNSSARTRAMSKLQPSSFCAVVIRLRRVCRCTPMAAAAVSQCPLASRNARNEMSNSVRCTRS